MPRGTYILLFFNLSFAFYTEAAVFWLHSIPNPGKIKEAAVATAAKEKPATGFAVAIARKNIDKYCKIDFEEHIIPTVLSNKPPHPRRKRTTFEIKKVSYDDKCQLHLELEKGNITIEESWKPEGYSLTTCHFQALTSVSRYYKLW